MEIPTFITLLAVLLIIAGLADGIITFYEEVIKEDYLRDWSEMIAPLLCLISGGVLALMAI